MFVFELLSQTVISAHWEMSIVASLHRSNPFALVTMGQRLAVPIVTIKTSLCEQPRGVKLDLRLHLRRVTNTASVFTAVKVMLLSVTLSCGYLLSRAVK